MNTSGIDEQKRIIAERDELLEFIRHWMYESRLQTFEDRDRFRKAADQLIAKATSAAGSVS